MEDATLVSIDQVLHEFLTIVNDPLRAAVLPRRAGPRAAARGQAAAPAGEREPAPPGVRIGLPHGRQPGAAPRDCAARGEFGVQLRPDEIVVTNGGMEAMYLALRSVAQAGDTIALESPTYFHLLQVIESLGMRVLEIPSHPRTGISVEALDFATQTPGAVRACVLLPNFPNPLGSLVPVVYNKRRIVQMMAERDIALIESDIYGETHFGEQRPPVLKSFDERNEVILCSAFTKTVAPGYRIGWVAPGRHFLKDAGAQVPHLGRLSDAAAGGACAVHRRRRLRPPPAPPARRAEDAGRPDGRCGRALLPDGLPAQHSPGRADAVDRAATPRRLARGVRAGAAGAHRRRARRGVQHEPAFRPLQPPAVRRPLVAGTRSGDAHARPDRRAARGSFAGHAAPAAKYRRNDLTRPAHPGCPCPAPACRGRRLDLH